MNNNIPVDIQIIDNENEKSFFINGELPIIIGFREFKLFLLFWKNLDLFRVSYNGVILNKDQKQEIYEQTSNYK